MLAPVRTAAPAETPVSLTEAKAHLRVTHTSEDDLITNLIQAATDKLDGWSGELGRALVTQTWRDDRAGFPRSRLLILGVPSVQSVTSITYYDADDAQQTLATSVYEGPFNAALGAYVRLKDGQSWPTTYDREDAVSTTYVAGYGAASAVPQPIKQAILLLVSHWYAARSAVSATPMSKIPMAVDALLGNYRRA